MTITEFLLARIEEDETIAREATEDSPTPWEICEQDDGLCGWIGDANDHSLFNIPGPARAVGLSDEAVVRHIANSDPERILRECEAKRRIIDIHRPSGAFAHCEGCDGGPLVEECDNLQALAAVYADHRDYNPAWAAP